MQIPGILKKLQIVLGATVLLACLYVIWKFEWGARSPAQTAALGGEPSPSAASTGSRCDR